MVLTLACGKFRFFDKDLGDIGGIPRLLRHWAMQRCLLCGGDSAGTGESVQRGLKRVAAVDDSVVVRAESRCDFAVVAVLGREKHPLGTKPARVHTPNVLKVLVDNFNIMPIKTVDEDLKAILG